jgi:Ca2+-transporting ATPase
LGINLIMIGAQVIIIFIGGKVFNVVHLNGAQWAYSIVLGFLSIPIGASIRLIPDELILRVIPDYIKQRPKGPQVTISDEEEHFRFPGPLAEVREELSFLKRVKGGRLNNLKFAIQEKRDEWLPRSRSGSRSRSNSIPQTPKGGESQREESFPTNPTPESSRKRGRSNRSRSNSALGATTVMAGIIAGSIAGWSPIERNYDDNDSVRHSRSKGRRDLESQDGVEIHSGTRADDPIILENPHHHDAPPSQIPELTPAPPNLSPPQSPPQVARRSS